MFLTPLQILQHAYDQMNHSKIKGSTTACIVAFDAFKRKLHWANLGDSGFILIRKGAKLLRAQEKQHRFNCPYQLGSGSDDNPRDSVRAETDIQDGDILILATDGFFDNVEDQEIVEYVNKFIAKREIQQNKQTLLATHNPVIGLDSDSILSSSIPSTHRSQHARALSTDSNNSNKFSAVNKNDELAGELAALANKFAHDRTKQTPFAKQCRAHGFAHSGGKVDDITVVVAEFKEGPKAKL